MTATRRAALVAVLALVGCSGYNKPKPAPLDAFTPTVVARQAWSARIDEVRFPLSIAAGAATVTVASSNGQVTAFDASNGTRLWSTSVGTPLTAGVGSDERFAAVVTRNNQLVVLENGREKWRARMRSRVGTAPLIAGERVFVLGVDRTVHAYDAVDGRNLWSLRRPSDALTLSQHGVVVPFKDTLLVGQGPMLAGVDPMKGSVRWEVALATPRGTNEVERLADLVGPALRAGDVVCTRAFQAAVGCVDAQRASLVWSKSAGGLAGIGGDAEIVAGADGSSRITAWKTANGDIAWTSERLLYRELSAPLAIGSSIVFGDVEGLLHVLDRRDGTTQLRLRTDGSAVIAAPVRVGGALVAVTRKGGVFAFRFD